MLNVLRAVKRVLGHVRRFVLNPRARSEMTTRWRGGARHYQGATHTARNRYPELFAACARELAGVSGLRILSFGCSTGEEVATLQQYLPGAYVVGVDLNAWCLREAARRFAAGRFLAVGSAEFAAEAAFDAVFCMAMFQRTENRVSRTEVALGDFTFEVFEEEIARLDGQLKVGGLLFLDEADYLFADTRVAARYGALEGCGVVQRRPLFGRDGRRVAEEYWVERGWRKLR